MHPWARVLEAVLLSLVSWDRPLFPNATAPNATAPIPVNARGGGRGMVPDGPATVSPPLSPAVVMGHAVRGLQSAPFPGLTPPHSSSPQCLG